MIRRLAWAAVAGILRELDPAPRPTPPVVVVPVVVQAPVPPPPSLPLALPPGLADHHDDDLDLDDHGGDCGCTPPHPDQPRDAIHQILGRGLWHLLLRTARHATNGETVEDAASLVMAELELEHTEAMHADQEDDL